MESTRITVTLEEDQYIALSDMAELSRLSLSDLVREAVSGFLHEAAWSGKGGVGEYAMDLIRAGKTNAETLAAVRAKFPQAKTSTASIAWYRSKLRRDGEGVQTDVAARRSKEAAVRVAKAGGRR